MAETFKGRVIDAGGGEVRLFWDRDQTASYPPVGTDVVVTYTVRQPDPSYLTRFVVEGRTHWVTWVEAMRGRTDLDQWEWADPWHGHWQQRVVVLTDAVPPDDFPVIVRRRV